MCIYTFLIWQVFEVYTDGAGNMLDMSLASDGSLYLEGRMGVGHARVLELRKQCGRPLHPRLSIRQQDAALGTAIIQLLVPCARRHRQPHALQLYASDRTRARPMPVPLISLGRKVTMADYTGVHVGEASGPVYQVSETHDGVGGAALRRLTLSVDTVCSRWEPCE